MAAPRKPKEAGIKFGDWVTIRQKGFGGFSLAYEAKHVPTGRIGIVKVVRPDFESGDPDDYKMRLRWFKDEADTLEKINQPQGHPNICRFYQSNFRVQRPWLAMELYNGNTIIEDLQQYGPADERIWWERARVILSGLAHVHAKGVVHRDLNPKNIIIDARGSKIIDFGISKPDDLTHLSVIAGANGWVAPEYDQELPTAAQDIFVLASLLVYYGTGKLAFKPSNTGNFNPSIKNDPANYYSLSTNQKLLLSKMHTKDPRQRIKAKDALALIEGLAQGYNSAPVAKKVVAAKQPPVINKPVVAKKPSANIPVNVPQMPKALQPGGFFSDKKSLLIWTIFTFGIALIPYWYFGQYKKTKDFGYQSRMRLVATSMLIAFGQGVTGALVMWWWLRKMGWAKSRLIFAGSTLVSTIAFIANVAESGQPASGLHTFFRIVGTLLPLLLWKKVLAYLTGVENGEIVEGKDKKSKPPAAKKDKEEVAEVIAPEVESEPVVITHGPASWEEVTQELAAILEENRQGRFSIDISSNHIQGIYFQGYSEEDGAMTVEAAANLSVRPKITTEQEQALHALGWELPSEGLPNFIIFLDADESSALDIAQLFADSLRNGYGLEIGTFKVVDHGR